LDLDFIDNMALAASDDTIVLADRTRGSSSNDADPYVLAIDRIRVAVTRHRTNKESFGDTKVNDGIVEESHRSQSPIGFTNDSQTIEDIEGILNELERAHRIPPPKLSHDSSKIAADLVSTADDNRQVVKEPPVSPSLYYSNLPVCKISFVYSGPRGAIRRRPALSTLLVSVNRTHGYGRR
jgi:hypothetical protein